MTTQNTAPSPLSTRSHNHTPHTQTHKPPLKECSTPNDEGYCSLSRCLAFATCTLRTHPVLLFHHLPTEKSESDLPFSSFLKRHHLPGFASILRSQTPKHVHAGTGHVVVLSFEFSCRRWDVGAGPGGVSLDRMGRGLELEALPPILVGMESAGSISFLANAFWQRVPQLQVLSFRHQMLFLIMPCVCFLLLLVGACPWAWDNPPLCLLRWCRSYHDPHFCPITLVDVWGAAARSLDSSPWTSCSRFVLTPFLSHPVHHTPHHSNPHTPAT